MATSTPFAYNTGSTIAGTTQSGDLAIGTPTAGFSASGLQWWNGPDEDPGYIVAQPVPGNTQPTPIPDDNITLSSTYKGVDISLSNNNQTAAQIFGYQQSVLGETIISGSNQVMFSVLSTPLEPLTLPQSRFIGVGKTTMNYQGNPYGGYPGNDTQSIGFNAIGEYYYNGSVVQSGLPTWTDSDIIDIAIAHGQYWWIRVNGGNWNNNPSANPTTLAGGLTMNDLTNFYPALCPGYQGIMTIQNNATYGVPSGYNFLGNVGASVGFFRSNTLTSASYISLVNAIAGPSGSFNTANAATTWLNDNGYWTSYPAGIAGSLVFNGTNQSLGISPGVTFGAGAFTVEGWFFNTSNFNSRGILGVPVSSNIGALNLYFANNTTITSDKNGGGGSFSYTMGSAITTNAWHYLIYNRNANGATAVYIDGVRCTATSSDALNYNTSTDTISRYYGGFWPGYWTNMRLTVGTAVYNSTSSTQSNPTAPLTVLANTKYLMLGAAVTTDSSGIQTVTNNNTVTQNSALVPF